MDRYKFLADRNFGIRVNGEIIYIVEYCLRNISKAREE